MKRDGFVYANREDVKNALDVLETSRADSQIDRNLRTATDSIEGLLHRTFYPEIDTRYFDWPNRQYTRPWKLWLDEMELISVSSLVSGGTALTEGTDFFLRNEAGDSKAPFNHIEINLGSNSAFSAGDSFQRSLVVTGLWAGCVEDLSDAGTLDGAITTDTTLSLSDGSLVGIGDLIKIESERIVITKRHFVDSTLNISSDVSQNVDTIPTSDGTAFNKGELILIGSEKMLITDIAGNNLLVKRAWDGSTLAAHTSADDIYVSRQFTAVRATLGTTIANHADTTAVNKFNVPPLINDLAIGETLVNLLQQRTGMARTIASGDAVKEVRGVGLADLRRQAMETYGRRARLMTV